MKKDYHGSICPDHLTPQEIEPLLNTEFIGKSIHYFETIESTNTYAKAIGTKVNDGTLIIAEEQTAGRGKLGRSFISPKYKGIWMSVILKPDINPEAASKLTQVAAASVVSAVKELHIDARVKWPNDILVNDKKICGILTEMSAKPSQINYVVVGIGININTAKDDFNNVLKDIATSLMIEKGIPIDRKMLLISVLNNFENLYLKFINKNDFESSLKICIDNSALIGREILILDKENVVEAKASGIDKEGKLIVQLADGTNKHLISGEVSIRNKK